jgi:hypothetical protein
MDTIRLREDTMEKSAMKNRIWGRLLVFALAVLIPLSPGCRKRSEDKEKISPLRVQEQLGPAEAKNEKAPRLGLMVNQLSEVDTYPGWPILVEVRVWHPRLYSPEAKAEPMTIASSGESWAGAISLSVTTSNGKATKVPLRLVPPKEDTLMLDDQNTGAMGWWLAGEDTAKLSEGDYLLVATLDTGTVKKPGIWQGKVESKPVLFHLRKEPSPLPEELAEEKLLLLAAYVRALGEHDKAKEYIDRLLAAQPENLQGLAFKAEQLEEEGDKSGALRTYEKAIAIFNRKYPDAEPPYELWKNHKRLLADLLKK